MVWIRRIAVVLVALFGLIPAMQVPARAADQPQATTPVFAAIYAGDAGALKAALDAGADVNARDATGDSPLHRASAGGNAEMVKGLLSKGAKVDARDDRQHTPLHWAAQNGHADVARLLLDAGADVNPPPAPHDHMPHPPTPRPPRPPPPPPPCHVVAASARCRHPAHARREPSAS